MRIRRNEELDAMVIPFSVNGNISWKGYNADIKAKEGDYLVIDKKLFSLTPNQFFSTYQVEIDLFTQPTIYPYVPETQPSYPFWGNARETYTEKVNPTFGVERNNVSEE